MKDQPLTEVEQARIRSLAEQSVKAVSEVLSTDEEVAEAVEAVIERAGAVAAAVNDSEDEQDESSSGEGDGSSSVGADGGGVTAIEED